MRIFDITQTNYNKKLNTLQLRMNFHTTINRFRDERLVRQMEELLYQFIGLLYESGELQYKNDFVEGTKIEAYANRYTFVWKN